MSHPDGDPEADKAFLLFLDETLLDRTGSTSSHNMNSALAPPAMGSGNHLGGVSDNRPAQSQQPASQPAIGPPKQSVPDGMSGPSGSAADTQVAAAEPRKGGQSRKSSRRGSMTHTPLQISAMAQVRSLESQVDGYHNELADLMRTNLHLKEREFMTQELLTYRIVQETFVRTGTLPASGAPLLGVSTLSTHAGLLGGGNQHAHAAKDSLGGSTNPLLECRDSVDQILRLSVPEMDAAYSSMVPELAIMLSQAEADPVVQEQLDQAMTNLHWAFETIGWMHPEAPAWLCERRDNPQGRGSLPEAKLHAVLASLKLSAKQIDRMGDVMAMLQPRLDAFAAEQQQLLAELHSQQIEAPPPPPPPLAGAALLGATAVASSAAPGNPHASPLSLLPEGPAAVPDELTAHLPLLIGLESDDTMTKLQRNVANMWALMCLLYSFVSSRILSRTQFARLHVNSFPWFPALDHLVPLALLQRGAGLPSPAANPPAAPVTLSARSGT